MAQSNGFLYVFISLSHHYGGIFYNIISVPCYFRAITSVHRSLRSQRSISIEVGTWAYFGLIISIKKITALWINSIFFFFLRLYYVLHKNERLCSNSLTAYVSMCFYVVLTGRGLMEEKVDSHYPLRSVRGWTAGFNQRRVCVSSGIEMSLIMHLPPRLVPDSQSHPCIGRVCRPLPIPHPSPSNPLSTLRSNQMVHLWLMCHWSVLCNKVVGIICKEFNTSPGISLHTVHKAKEKIIVFTSLTKQLLTRADVGIIQELKLDVNMRLLQGLTRTKAL